MTKRLTTRGIETAQAIANRETFTTSGSFSARVLPDGGLGAWDSGRLSGADLDKFRKDCNNIEYVVWSYATPIAWYVAPSATIKGGWYKVAQKFSVTTSKHQGNLYLI